MTYTVTEALFIDLCLVFVIGVTWLVVSYFRKDNTMKAENEITLTLPDSITLDNCTCECTNAYLFTAEVPLITFTKDDKTLTFDIKDDKVVIDASGGLEITEAAKLFFDEFGKHMITGMKAEGVSR